MIMVRPAAGNTQFIQFLGSCSLQRSGRICCLAQLMMTLKCRLYRIFLVVAALQVPDGIVTGFDAVQYFCSGAGKPGDLIYCNMCSASIHSSSSTGASTTLTASTRDPDHCALLQPQKVSAEVVTDTGFCGDGYNPYDLVAVPQRLADRRHHFVVSYHGVTQMKWVAVRMPA